MRTSLPTSASPNLDDDARAATGSEGLDEVLGGGLPAGCFFLIQGDPGSGKTTLALQFLLEGVRRGEAPFYITLSETKRELEKVARSHGWSLDGIPLLELSAMESLLRPEAQTTIFRPSEVQLGEITRVVIEQLDRHLPRRVIFDSLSEFRLIAETPLRYRRQLLTLKQEFARRGCTVLLLDDKMEAAGAGADPHVLSLAHGVIEMEQFSPSYGTARRRLRVLKMRGVKYHEGYHDYAILRGSVNVFPRLALADHRHEYRPEAFPSGVPELDRMLGGGLDRGTTTLVVGPAGSGKSSLALQYVHRCALAGERAAVFAFDETRSLLLGRAEKLGLDLRPYTQSGLVAVHQVDPAELSPGEFALRLRKEVEAGCRAVVIDSINGYINAMPGDNYLNNQLHELCSFLNQRRVLTILILAQQGVFEAATAPVDISYLADTVLLLRFFEMRGEVRQAATVVKKRSGSHEKTIREFKLETGRGVCVGQPLAAFQGVLTAAPVFHGQANEMLNPPP